MEEIELRSEETRHFMNDIPPILTRIGTVLIVLIIIALGIAAYKIPYPISIEAEGTVKNKYKLEFFVPQKYLYILDEEKTAYAQQKVHARIIIENKTLWQQFFMR